jgi:aryl-alcohol dehydrogenase-like predicted oxidoreductase
VSKYLNITDKMVLGTAQFGMDYGIANVSGKPTKKEVFNILSLAWENGIQQFDTAPGYASESLLGEFIKNNGIQDKVKVLTKIPSLNGMSDYKTRILSSIQSSLNNLGCHIDVLFFHNSADFELLFKDPYFFESLLHDYPISSLGVSVYEPTDVENVLGCPLELAFQFPFNVLDRRFENVKMPKSKRYARSIFLQGLLASVDELRPDSPKELQNLQKNYHEKLAKNNLDPVSIAVSFVAQNDVVDYFLIGVDSEKQLKELLDLELFGLKDIAFSEMLIEKKDKRWFDPRKWN